MFQDLSYDARMLRKHAGISCAAMLTLASLGAIFPALRSVAAQSDQVDEFLQVEMKKRKIPGLALAVIKNGEVIKMQGYGLANLDHDVPVTPDTVFELASVTKQFTATAIMLLEEEGKVKLDDPIREYLPHSPEQWKGIRVRHLNAMWTPAKLNSGSSTQYGFGWGFITRGGHRMIQHIGLTGTEYSRYPDHKLSVIVLTNLGGSKAQGVRSWGLVEGGIAGRFVPELLPK
jgi:CubicO group peptidase (beta-lactamase class C family)